MPLPSPMFRFILDVVVTDPSQLHAAARMRAAEEGSSMGRGFPPLADCIQMLLDPGSLAGCSILGSEVERTNPI